MPSLSYSAHVALVIPTIRPINEYNLAATFSNQTSPFAISITCSLTASETRNRISIVLSVLLNYLTALKPSTLRDLVNVKTEALNLTMSFSNLVSDIAFRDAHPDDRSSQVSHARSQATARSYTSTTATSVSISGDISSQLHAGYSHPLSRSWQAERQLTKV